MSFRFVPVVLLALAPLLSGAPDTDYKIDRGLMSVLTDDAEATAPFFVVFGDRADVKAAYRIPDWAARGRFVVQSLQAVAGRSQAGTRAFLQARGVVFTAFWVENKIYVGKGDLELARALARRPEVVAIIPEAIYKVPTPQAGAIQGIEWNISKIRADQAWATTKGAGLVVANIDTGVQYTHPALALQYRGYPSSHTGNWKDPTGVCGATPCDNNGHGTHTMGTMVGDDGAGNQIGVAPGAQWIACKGCGTNTCASSSLTACAQWILDPLGNSSGQNRPHVVNNSWGGGGGDAWYLSYVQNWRAAGIFPAFSAGNSGPNCGTAGSPGDYAESFASGATDINDNIASYSSRGPSKFGGIKPNVSAPGSGVRSSVPTNSYATYSGTSMASPHTAGTVALVWSAAPAYKGNVSGTEAVLKNSAVVRTTSETCGGVPAGATPNNTYGWGRLDARAAVDAATGGTPNQPPVVLITAPANGSSYACPATVTFTGTATDPEDGDLTASLTWTDNGAALGTGGSVVKTYQCTDAGTRTIVASVTDSGGAKDTDTIAITITTTAVPAAPTNLKASVSGSNVVLTWQDNSSNETGFRVQRKPKSGSWSTIGTTGAGITTYSNSPGPGSWQYRVFAYNAAGDSASSNVVSARVR